MTKIDRAALNRATVALYNSPDRVHPFRDNELTWEDAEHYAEIALAAAGIAS